MKREHSSMLKYELDRYQHVEVELRREISQKNLQIEELKAEQRRKLHSFQEELSELNSIRDSLESDNKHLKYVSTFLNTFFDKLFFLQKGCS